MAGIGALLRRIEFKTGGYLTPVVTVCMAVNFALLLAMIFTGGRESPLFEALWVDGELIARGQVWRLLTGAIMHGDPSHFFFNMLGLFFFGNVVERYLGTRGMVVYVVAIAVIGNLVHAMVYPEIPGVGFSGVVIAAIVSFATIAPKAPIYFMLLFRMPAWVLAAAIVGLDFLNLLYVEMSGVLAPIAYLVHLVGAASGFAAIAGMPWLRTRRRRISRALDDRAERREDADHVEIDRLLEKVSREGLASLSDAERRFLDRYSHRNR